jgi:hypothetical protein
VSGSSTAHARLERIKLALATKRQPAPDDVAWALSIDAESIRHHAGADAGLEEARRLIVELSRRFSLTSAEMSKRIERYEATAWLRGERLADECPRHRVGHVEEFCWKILRAYRAPSDRTIRRILEIEAVAKSRGAMATGHS